MTQNNAAATTTDAFATITRIANVAQFFKGVAENREYAVITDTGRTRTFPTRTSARRFAEVVATRNDGEAQVWSSGRPVAMIANHIGWCVPAAV